MATKRSFQDLKTEGCMKANIEISERTMDRLAGALDLSPLYDEDYGVDEENLSYAIKLMVDLCAD